ncbi:MAG TPA: proline hydroxylase, partial [Porticoccaceae bacterium]|nr:proline hydroxylase [Porticoccaceae bacterium]
ENSATISEETVAGDYILKGKGSKVNGSSLIDLSDDLRNEIHDQLKTSMERWSGQDLLPTYVYGIRIYHRGAILRPHRDRLATHIIGAIINVAQDVDEDWPLIIYDHQHREHSVILKPGDVVFYESGTLIHGRPSPLNGNSFANVFCHCKPVNYVPRPTITN